MINNDGYMNIFSGIGTDRDPIQQAKVVSNRILTAENLDNIFVSDGVGRRIVTIPAEDMCRQWFEVDGDRGGDVMDRFEELHLKQCFIDAATWSRLYGGAIAVFVTDQAGDSGFQSPLRPGEKLLGIRTFDRNYVSWQPDRPSTDVLRRLRGMSEFVNVSPSNGEQISVHESRFVYVPGNALPERMWRANGGWDASALEGALEALLRYSTGLGSSSAILKDFIQAVLSVTDLTDLVASGKEEVVRRRLQLLDMSRSILNTMIIDASGEQYTKQASSVAGISDLIDRYVEHLSAVTGIPTSKLIGKTPGSLGSTGFADLQNYYEFLGSEQRRVLGELAERTVRLVYQEGGSEPSNWSVRWNPIYSPSDKEVAELRKIVAETDQIYVANGVLSASEVAESRFGDGWSMDTELVASTDRKEEAAGSDEDMEKATEQATAIATATAPTEEEAEPRGAPTTATDGEGGAHAGAGAHGRGDPLAVAERGHGDTGDQPRVPAGSPAGGQFVSKSGPGRSFAGNGELNKALRGPEVSTVGGGRGKLRPVIKGNLSDEEKARITQDITSINEEQPGWMRSVLAGREVWFDPNGTNNASQYSIQVNTTDRVVVHHELSHLLDGELSGGRKSLEWKTDDPKLNQLAAEARQEFVDRSRSPETTEVFSVEVGKNLPLSHHGGDWSDPYMARIYPGDGAVSSEYLAVNTQYYIRGSDGEDRVRKESPAMGALLDYMWKEKK